MKIKAEEYLVDGKGAKSSTRLFSYLLLRFFFWFVPLALLVFGGMIIIMRENLDAGVIITMGTTLIVLILILGMMIFAPKQLAKVQEMKELIAMIK